MDHNPLHRIRHPLGHPGWRHPSERGDGIVQIADWLPADDTAWLERHLELAGFEYGQAWYSGIWF